MHQLKSALDFVLHLDKGIAGLVSTYGTQIYILLCSIIFCETGLVILPFLPGDSLLFATGVIAAKGSLSYPLLFVLLSASALLGDNVNYFLGKTIGVRIEAKGSRFVKNEHLVKTHAFYEKHGGKTVIMARFVPIVRTFAPFVAGIGAMTYRQFIKFSIVGAFLWVGTCLSAGYFLGNIAFIKKHFELAVLAIIIVSVLPMAIEVYRERRKSALEAKSEAQ